MNTRLLPLDVLGQGTGDVECLSSYLIRLSTIHAAPATSLIRFALDQRYAKGAGSMGGIFTSSSSRFVRPNQTTEYLVRALAHALGVADGHLDQTTFLAFHGALARSERTFAKTLRWCPDCMGLGASGKPPYFRLVWQLQPVVHCTRHGALLRDACASCGAQQDGVRPRRDLSACVRCSASLSLGSKPASPSREGPELQSVIQYCAEHPGFRFPASGVHRFLEALLDAAWETGKEERLYRMVGRDQLLSLLCRNHPITLKTALSISHALDYPLLGVLKGEIAPYTSSLPGILASPSSAGKALERRRIDDPLAMRRRIARAMGTVSYATPLRALATSLDVSVGALRYRFPDLVEEWVLRFKVSCRQHRRSILSRCREVVRRGIEDLRSACPVALSGRALFRRLRAETGLPEDVLKHEIRRQLDHTAKPRRLSP
ncbi:MAG: TniQ family protein [Xanthomonadales bacterium]|nr:TniQ family protein [Xanthomonadales bacterium]